MKNKYVDFISDEHLLNCVGNLHNAYLKAKKNITKKNFYNNKIDTFKLTFDSKFNELSEENLIQAEVLRQIDKSINNSIGTFHEEVLGGIENFEIGNFSGFDIKAKDDSLLAIFGRKEISQNISDAVFDKLANTARIYKNAKLYFVLIDDNSEINKKWIIGNEEYKVSQKRVFKISLTQFYAEVTKKEKAYEQLFKILPIVSEDYFLSNSHLSRIFP